MSDTANKSALGEALNGVKTPLYFDRQVIRASDLTLDRESHDEELARMRRLLHGWGIVTGFDVIQQGDTILVGRGYGISPTGAEVFLRERIGVTNLGAHIWSCCGPGAVDCTLIDEADILRRAAAAELTTTRSWLIARPMRSHDELRPGIAGGCEHPANTLLPTRACEGVRLELLCDLQPPHILTELSCEAVSPQFCKRSEGRSQPFLAMPPTYGDELSYLVLCRLICRFADDNLNVSMQPVNRKTLLPISVMQQFLQTCVCPVLDEPEADVETDDDDDGPGDNFIPESPNFDWNNLRERFREEDLFEPRDIIKLGGGVTDPPRLQQELALFKDAQVVAKLDAAGVTGPLAFIEADAAVIATATGLAISAVEKIKLALGKVRHLFDGPRF